MEYYNNYFWKAVDVLDTLKGKLNELYDECGGLDIWFSKEKYNKYNKTHRSVIIEKRNNILSTVVWFCESVFTNIYDFSNSDTRVYEKYVDYYKSLSNTEIRKAATMLSYVVLRYVAGHVSDCNFNLVNGTNIDDIDSYNTVYNAIVNGKECIDNVRFNIKEKFCKELHNICRYAILAPFLRL